MHPYPAKWMEWISLAEYWFNSSSFHSALGRTPFKALYGYVPCSLGVDDTTRCPVPELEEWIRSKRNDEQTLAAPSELCSIAHEVACRYATHWALVCCRWLGFVKVQPYVQSSLALRAHQKLSFKFFSPFKVLERVGSVSYKLQLPACENAYGPQSGFWC